MTLVTLVVSDYREKPIAAFLIDCSSAKLKGLHIFILFLLDFVKRQCTVDSNLEI